MAESSTTSSVLAARAGLSGCGQGPVSSSAWRGDSDEEADPLLLKQASSAGSDRAVLLLWAKDSKKAQVAGPAVSSSAAVAGNSGNSKKKVVPSPTPSEWNPMLPGGVS